MVASQAAEERATIVTTNADHRVGVRRRRDALQHSLSCVRHDFA
jgi:hypothetical protein